MESIDSNILITSITLCVIGISSIIFTLGKRKSILSKATKSAEIILTKNKNKAEWLIASAEKKKFELITEANINKKALLLEAEKGVVPFHERVERLKIADKEITSRLRQSRAIIEDITDKSCSHAADIELLTEEDLLSSNSYQEDRKEIKSRLKALAINAIDGVKGSNSDVNIGKFISISAKADMAGALLLTTVEMLCTKTNANNGHQALEKLAESIIATEALIKCIDSRASINKEFKTLLSKRLEIEINYKKAKQISKEEQRELREQEREEKKVRQEAEKIQKEAENEERIKSKAVAEL